MRTRHLISSPAVNTRCRVCRRPILAGLDGGVPVKADPTPLTPGQELAILAGGGTTYGRLRDRSLGLRTAARIAAGEGHPVHADHACRSRPGRTR